MTHCASTDAVVVVCARSLCVCTVREHRGRLRASIPGTFWNLLSKFDQLLPHDGEKQDRRLPVSRQMHSPCAHSQGWCEAGGLCFHRLDTAVHHTRMHGAGGVVRNRVHGRAHTRGRGLTAGRTCALCAVRCVPCAGVYRVRSYQYPCTVPVAVYCVARVAASACVYPVPCACPSSCVYMKNPRLIQRG